MKPNGPSTEADPVAIHPPVYPMLGRVVRYGDQVGIVMVGAVIVLGGLWSWTNANPWLALATLLAAAGVYVFVRTAVELIRLVCDMLLPK